MAFCTNCMQQGKYIYLFCLLLCLTGVLVILNISDGTRDLLQRTIHSKDFTRFAIPISSYIARGEDTGQHAQIPGMIGDANNPNRLLNASVLRAAFEEIAEENFLVAPELPLEKVVVEERKYRHDDQHEKYMRCPTTVRKKLLSDPVVGKKLVPDIPILMWDKHFNASEYQRLTQFKGINGWRGTNHTDIRNLLTQLNSPNNGYMFDDRLKNGEPPQSDCIRCAVIGNGGILNGSRKGAEIDAHDYVFRVNAAITDNYEQDVGRKTSFYCFTMVTLSNTMALSRRTGFHIPKGDEKLRYLFFADSEWTYTYLSAVLAGRAPPTSVGRYHRKPPDFPRKLTAENVKVLHPDFERYLKWSWVNSSAQHKDVHRPTTGAIMLLAALHTCDEVNIYGFAGSYSEFSEHYYDKTYSKHVNYANHDNGAENKLWDLLDQRGIISLYRREKP
ncbi:alpha-N-acetylgalactosaminide alpha-2,6-sialyltransferase 2-like isoform X2 [Diadema antillarum]|uniref:alpha-N-acetylgalactosaminide alpha-2,6-sialyltransferase 2-like isoform X2 n=1 Tax=Diadema antillarum TaxID=105358 RepID=UPI003A865FF9